jgi:hypothetical protein
MAKVVESLLGKYKALSSKLQYHQKKKKFNKYYGVPVVYQTLLATRHMVNRAYSCNRPCLHEASLLLRRQQSSMLYNFRGTFAQTTMGTDHKASGQHSRPGKTDIQQSDS